MKFEASETDWELEIGRKPFGDSSATTYTFADGRRFVGFYGLVDNDDGITSLVSLGVLEADQTIDCQHPINKDDSA